MGFKAVKIALQNTWMFSNKRYHGEKGPFGLLGERGQYLQRAQKKQKISRLPNINRCALPRVKPWSALTYMTPFKCASVTCFLRVSLVAPSLL